MRLKEAAGLKSAYIAQGEYAVGDETSGGISTILGSCVSTCLWDPVAKVGGMNHFLLPDAGSANGDASSFGANAMELLINALIHKGAARSRLRSKVFGGAQLTRGLTDAGSRNAEFALSYLSREGIPCDGQSVGGTQARRIEFSPLDGRARQKFVEDTHVKEVPTTVQPAHGLELF